MLTALYVYLIVGFSIGIIKTIIPVLQNIGTYFYNRKHTIFPREYNSKEDLLQNAIIMMFITLPVINIITVIIYYDIVSKRRKFL